MPRMYNPVIDVNCTLSDAKNDLIQSVREKLNSDSLPHLEPRIDSILSICMESCQPRGVYKLYNPAICTLPPAYTEPAIKLVGTMAVLHGKATYEKLSEAKHCALIAATLGIDEDALAGKIAATNDDAVIMNACFDSMFQRCQDIIGNEITKAAMAKGLYTDDLFSFGMEGFPSEQLSDLLFYTKSEEKLGIRLRADENGIDPMHSTVGIIALIDPSKGKRRSCGLCHYRDFCSIRAIGMTCHGRKRTFDES